MPDPIDEAREATEAVQRSRLRVNQVWKHRRDADRYALVVGFEVGFDGHRVELLPCTKPNDGPHGRHEVIGPMHKLERERFFESYELCYEPGNKELDGGTDLTEKLKQIRRDPGRGLGRAIDLIGDRRREYEAQHARPEATENWWWQRLDERTHPAALELSQRRLDLLFEIGERQAELDRIDTALSSLASIEIPRAGE